MTNFRKKEGHITEKRKQKRVFRVVFSYLKNTCLGCVLKVLLRGWYPAWNTSGPPGTSECRSMCGSGSEHLGEARTAHSMGVLNYAGPEVTTTVNCCAIFRRGEALKGNSTIAVTEGPHCHSCHWHIFNPETRNYESRVLFVLCTSFKLIN